MREKRMGWKEKYRLYYDKVIDMHFNQGLGYLKISKLVPVSKSGICKWINNFTAEKENQYPKVMRGKASRPIEQRKSSAFQ